MFVTKLKTKDDLSSRLHGGVAVIICVGCREVYFPEADFANMMSLLSAEKDILGVISSKHLCNPDNLSIQLEVNQSLINSADMVLVFSCGIGTQTVASALTDKRVISGCDSLPLPCYQGVTPLEFDCACCGHCHLNQTGGICPITSCSKSLTNGQCGGSKNGMCEADSNMECGWERIAARLRRNSVNSEK